MIKTILLFIYILWTFSGQGLTVKENRERILDGVYQPDFFSVDRTHLYIVQQHQVFIFVKNSGKLLKRFGSRGDGPRAFRGSIKVYPTRSELIVSSAGKISRWQKNGEYISEKRIDAGKAGKFVPYLKGFIGQGFELDKRGRYSQCLLFVIPEKKMRRILYRFDSGGFAKGKKGRRGKFNLMDRNYRQFAVAGSDVFLALDDGRILKLNADGKQIGMVKGKYKAIPFLEHHRHQLTERFLLANAAKRGSFDQWKNLLIYPEFFPPIQWFGISGDRLVVLTHYRKAGTGELHIFDLSGKLLGIKMVPIFDYSPKDPYPLFFFHNKLYQIAEDTDKEDWLFYVNEIVL